MLRIRSSIRGLFLGLFGVSAAWGAWLVASGCGSIAALARPDASTPWRDSSAANAVDGQSAFGDASLGPSCSVCSYRSPPWIRGRLSAPQLTETSGLAASRVHPGILYAHNDSGDTARLFRLNEQAELQSILNVSLNGALPRDWEDMAVGACSPSGDKVQKSCIFVGDIGDNGRSRGTVTLYRMLEPSLDVTMVAADTFSLLYPDGPHNAETLLVDEQGGIYIVTKELAGIAQLYAFGIPGAPATMLKGKLVGTVTPPVGSETNLITGGDYFGGACPRMVLRTYRNVLLFEGLPGEGPEMLSRRPFRLLASPDEPQGEAVAFSADGQTIFTASEGRGGDDGGAPLYQFACDP